MERAARIGTLILVAVVPWAASAISTLAGRSASAVSANSTGEPATSAPARLSETGLYAAEGTIAPHNLPFSPQYPLWSDGASKSRWIYLPPGTTIDVSDVDAWRFPAGTKLWKEFSWEGRKVETRMIWKPNAESWIFASYIWNEDQNDAVLAPSGGVPRIAEIASGKQHSIPSTADCLACHGSSPAIVLGFTALQLSDERDPLAPHAEPLPAGAATLRSFHESGRLVPSHPELVEDLPRIRGRSPVERAALGYLSANCGGCHNQSGPLARLGLRLLHEVAQEEIAAEPALASAVDATGRYLVPGVAAQDSRIVAPGQPARSALHYRMRSRRPSSQMPPLGTVIADSAAVELIEIWIAGLGAQQPGDRDLARQRTGEMNGSLSADIDREN